MSDSGSFYHVDYSLQPMPNFTLEEAACNCGCGLVVLNPKLLFHLYWVRKLYDAPIYVSSWFRCKSWNKHEGGKRKSYHLYGKAIDMQPSIGKPDHRFIESCNQTFPFVLLYKTFAHCDIRGPRSVS